MLSYFYYEKGVDATLNASNDDYQSVWFTINPESKALKSGEYKIKATMTSLKTNEVIAEENINIPS
mgnify:CR=1 FL=1